MTAGWARYRSRWAEPLLPRRPAGWHWWGCTARLRPPAGSQPCIFSTQPVLLPVVGCALVRAARRLVGRAGGGDQSRVSRARLTVPHPGPVHHPPALGHHWRGFRAGPSPYCLGCSLRRLCEPNAAITSFTYACSCTAGWQAKLQQRERLYPYLKAALQRFADSHGETMPGNTCATQSMKLLVVHKLLFLLQSDFATPDCRGGSAGHPEQSHFDWSDPEQFAAHKG